MIGISADVAKDEEIQQIIDGVEKSFGGVDILINNAGTGSNEKIMTAPDEKWQYYWDLHVMAAVQLARGLVPLMVNRDGYYVDAWLDMAKIFKRVRHLPLV